MRIAVQLSGHLRTFRDCSQQLIDNFLKYYDTDIFIHTWDETEHKTQSWYPDDLKSTITKVDENLINQIKSIYNPKALKIETQNLFNESGFFGTHDKIRISLEGMKYQLYSKFAVNKLRKNYAIENSIKYDYVVVIRPDLFPLVKIELEKYEKEFKFYKKTSIHFVHKPEILIKTDKIFVYPLLADTFFYSTPEVVDIISSIYKEFDFYFKKISSIFPKQIECPETAFFEYLAQKKIIPRMYVNYYSIKRKNDKDDIKLLPPSNHEVSENNLKINDSKKVIFVKLFFRIILFPFPNYINLKIKRNLKVLANVLYMVSSQK